MWTRCRSAARRCGIARRSSIFISAMDDQVRTLTVRQHRVRIRVATWNSERWKASHRLAGVAADGALGQHQRQETPAGFVIIGTVGAREAGLARRSPSRWLSAPSPYSACSDSGAPSSGHSPWPLVDRSGRRLERRRIYREPSAVMKDMGLCPSIHTRWVLAVRAETPRTRRVPSKRSLPEWSRRSTSQSERFFGFNVAHRPRYIYFTLSISPGDRLGNDGYRRRPLHPLGLVVECLTDRGHRQPRVDLRAR